jgi:DNA-binding LacI/PurR family transcriptional regulator
LNIFDQIILDPSSGTTLAQQLKQQLGWLIATGELRAGDRLPSVRLAASHLSINLHTVRSAYRKLEDDGLVETCQGLGTQVLPYDQARMAQLASSQHSHTIGVLIPDLNPFYQPFIRGIEQAASLSRTLTFLCLTKDDPGETTRYYSQLAARQVDGLILTSQDNSRFLPSNPKELEASLNALPIVSVDWPNSPGYSVELDLEGAGYLAARHLLEHGHKRVGLITVAWGGPNIDPLVRGYRKALDESGVKAYPELVVGVDGFDPSAGEAGAWRLLQLEAPPTGVFVIADQLALGALRHFKRAGKRIPQDIALTSFNDIHIADLVDPPLTTVAAPAYQMGVEAVKMLESLIAGKRPRRKRLLLPCSLVVRQSCGQHPSEQEIVKSRI